jgi:hypothetical protein
VAEGRQDGSELVSQNPTLIKHCVPDDGSDSLLAEHGGAQDLHWLGWPHLVPGHSIDWYWSTGLDISIWHKKQAVGDAEGLQESLEVAEPMVQMTFKEEDRRVNATPGGDADWGTESWTP